MSDAVQCGHASLRAVSGPDGLYRCVTCGWETPGRINPRPVAAPAPETPRPTLAACPGWPKCDPVRLAHHADCPLRHPSLGDPSPPTWSDALLEFARAMETLAADPTSTFDDRVAYRNSAMNARRFRDETAAKLAAPAAPPPPSEPADANPLPPEEWGERWDRWVRQIAEGCDGHCALDECVCGMEGHRHEEQAGKCAECEQPWPCPYHVARLAGVEAMAELLRQQSPAIAPPSEPAADAEADPLERLLRLWRVQAAAKPKDNLNSDEARAFREVSECYGFRADELEAALAAARAERAALRERAARAEEKLAFYEDRAEQFQSALVKEHAAREKAEAEAKADREALAYQRDALVVCVENENAAKAALAKAEAALREAEAREKALAEALFEQGGATTAQAVCFGCDLDGYDREKAPEDMHDPDCQRARAALRERAAEAEAAAKREREDHLAACALVASMHAAAVGEVRGPDVGPVEDVAALRARMLAAEAALREIANLPIGADSHPANLCCATCRCEVVLKARAALRAAGAKGGDER